jgi:hypothetical protein
VLRSRKRNHRDAEERQHHQQKNGGDDAESVLKFFHGALFT